MRGERKEKGRREKEMGEREERRERGEWREEKRREEEQQTKAVIDLRGGPSHSPAVHRRRRGINGYGESEVTQLHAPALT